MQPDRASAGDCVKLIHIAGGPLGQRLLVARVHLAEFRHAQTVPSHKRWLARIRPKKPPVQARGRDVESPVVLVRVSAGYLGPPQQAVGR